MWRAEDGLLGDVVRRGQRRLRRAVDVERRRADGGIVLELQDDPVVVGQTGVDGRVTETGLGRGVFHHDVDAAAANAEEEPALGVHVEVARRGGQARADVHAIDVADAQAHAEIQVFDFRAIGVARRVEHRRPVDNWVRGLVNREWSP